MAQLFSTGPAYLYVSYASAGSSDTTASLLTYPPKASTYFLGTCEKAPSISIEPAWMPLKADIAGPMIPWDHLFVGEVAIISGVLNRWNEAVYTDIATRPQQSGTRGSYTNKDIGRPMLMSGRGRAFCLWVQFPYQSKSVYSSTPKAYRFPGAYLLGPDVIVPGAGSRRALTFLGSRVYNPTGGTWTVYDHAVADPGDATNALPAVPPITADGVIT